MDIFMPWPVLPRTAYKHSRMVKVSSVVRQNPGLIGRALEVEPGSEQSNPCHDKVRESKRLVGKDTGAQDKPANKGLINQITFFKC